MTTETTDPYTLVLFTAQSGALSARLDHDDGSILHLHSLVDPENETVCFSDLQFWGDRILLSGCGLGYHLKRAIGSIISETRILLAEYYDELAERCLELFPPEIRGRVTVITKGESRVTEKVREFLAGGHYVQVVKHPPSWHAHREYYRSIAAQCSGTPLPRQADTVLMLQGNFFLEKELSAASAGSTAKVLPFNYNDHATIIAYESEFQKRLQKDRPAAVLSINLLGVDGNGILAEYCRRAGIPLIVWFVDDPRPILLNRMQHLSEGVIVFSWERAYLPWLRQQGFGDARYLPLASDPAQFAVPRTRRPSVGCAFVGTAMGSSFLKEIAEKFMWKPEYARVAAAVAFRICSERNSDVDRLLDDECATQSVVLPLDSDHTRTWLRSYCIHTASMIMRKRMVTGLLSSGIETFGDPEGWRELAGPGLTVHGTIDYRTEIGDCYRSIAVNLNCTSCQMPTAVNQRVFDVPLSGAFIINDDQSDLHELFAENEYVTYSSVEECAEKVAFYRENESARTAVSDTARKRILGEHTYTHRLQSLLHFK
ncbi:MAG: glycosyltransferase [Chitinispirillaceae bacterium]|nr:glycosyltransferase [Chitinispirillaceae bacterium]